MDTQQPNEFVVSNLEPQPSTTTPETPELYAGKYKTVDDLVNGYKELEKKLGSQPPPTPSSQPTPPTTPSKIDLQAIATEHLQANGNLSETSLKQLESMGFNKDSFNIYMEGMKAQANKVLDAVGGADSVKTMIDWARENLPATEVAELDTVLNGGSTERQILTLKGLKASYEEANGKAPALITGSVTPATAGDVYQSMRQVVEATKDPRYKKDPAYYQEHVAKIKRSTELGYLKR